MRSKMLETQRTGNKIGAMDSGQRRLQELGYKQELNRSVSSLSNFALCFSVMSVLTGITTTYNTGLAYGGPVSIIYGWMIVSSFTTCIALSMAEICSAYPTSGGLYFWSHKLAGKKWGPFMAWMTGWFNNVGLWIGAAAVDFSLATLLQAVIYMATGGGNGGGFYLSKYQVMLIYAGILILHGLVNSLAVHWLSWLGSFAAVWNTLGVLIMGITLLAISPRQNARFVFTYLNEDNDSGIQSKPYIFLLGLLMSQYTILGYDTSAHMTEETRTADKAGAYGIVGAVVGSVAMGTLYLLPLIFTSFDVGHLLDPNNNTRGYAVAQLVYDAFQNKFNNGKWGVSLMIIPCGAIYMCGAIAVTATSRMTYAFSRDGALPLSKLWHIVNKQDVPINAVWLCVVIAFCVVLPYLGSTVAFQATVSIATIALNIAYTIPIALRVTLARHTFVPGPFNLGKFSLTIGWMAVLWVCITTVLFSLPVAYPITIETLNYTPIALGALSILTLLYWGLSGRHWFKGPVPNIDTYHEGTTRNENSALV